MSMDRIRRATLAVIAIMAPSFSIGAAMPQKKDRCKLSVGVEAVTVRVDSLDFSWTIPTSCDSTNSVAILDMKYGTCTGANNFDFKSATPYTTEDDGVFGSITGPFIVTLADLKPNTRYCFGFKLMNGSRQTFGPFIGSSTTKPDIPTTIKSKNLITGPEMELRYHVIDLDLDIVQVSTADTRVQQYLELMQTKFSAQLISNLYTTDRCGYPLDPSATVSMRYEPDRLVRAGINPSQLAIFELEPTDKIAVQLENHRIDVDKHLITAFVSVLNCPNFVPVGAKALPSNFGIFSSSVSHHK